METPIRLLTRLDKNLFSLLSNLRNQVLYQFETLEKAHKLDGPFMIFTHIYPPHPPIFLMKMETHLMQTTLIIHMKKRSLKEKIHSECKVS